MEYVVSVCRLRVDPVCNAKDPHAIYVSNIEQEQVRTAIKQLSDESREIIILREYEGLSYQAIAKVLECQQGDSDVTPGKSAAQAQRAAFPQ
jgi:RNA polymerase sigma-70 factor (ECF subfamily)